MKIGKQPSLKLKSVICIASTLFFCVCLPQNVADSVRPGPHVPNSDLDNSVRGWAPESVKAQIGKYGIHLIEYN